MTKKILLYLIMVMTFFFGLSYVYAEEENLTEGEDKPAQVVNSEIPAYVAPANTNTNISSTAVESTAPASNDNSCDVPNESGATATVTTTAVDDDSGGNLNGQINRDVTIYNENGQSENLNNQQNENDQIGNLNNQQNENDQIQGNENQNSGNEILLMANNENDQSQNDEVLDEPSKAEEQETTTTINRDYRIESGEGKSVTLSKMFEDLGIDLNLTNVDRVDSSKPSQIVVTPTSGNWTISSPSVFLTQETLMVELKDGTKYVIRLTDSTVPDHSKTLVDNEDGTYTIELTITGEAEKKPNNVNVVVVLDVSGSMDQRTGNTEVSYTETSTNANNLYGKVGDDYVPLTRLNGYVWVGPGRRDFEWFDNVYYYNYVNINNRGTLYTGQRYTRQEANQTRLDAAKGAVNSLADSLLSKNGADDNPDDLVEMALIVFSTNALVKQTPTTSLDTFKDAVDGLEADGGTNWEAALAAVNSINFDDSDPIFVIFVSDGNPTFRDTQGTTDSLPNDNPRWNNTQYNYYKSDDIFYESDGVYGLGSDNPDTNNYSPASMQRCYDNAVDDAQAIVSSIGNKNFYTIGAYGTVDRMSSLTTAAGSPASNSFTAANTAGLQDAFNTILTAIEMAGFSGVGLDDGTTSYIEHTNYETTSDVSHLLVVDESSYKYYKIKNGVAEEWTDAPGASLDDKGHVTWNLSGEGVLENGVIYKVTFRVWPSQETLDLIADLKNNPSLYSKLDSNITRYLVADGNGGYTLKTNTTASLTFTDTRDENPQQTTATYSNPDPVNTMATESLAVSKKWENELDDREHEPIEIEILRDGERFGGTNGTKISLSKTNNWKGSVFIAIGIMLVDEANNVTVLASGHDYSFAELGDDAYNWQLKAGVVRPMLVNGTLTLLYNNGTKVPEGTEGVDWYKINTGTESNPVYTYYIKGEEGQNAALTATNERRSYLDISKDVEGTNLYPTQTFDFVVTVDDPNDDDIWFAVKETNDEDARFITPEEDELIVIGNNLVREIKTLTANEHVAEDSIIVTEKDSYSILTFTYCKLNDEEEEVCKTQNMILIGEAYQNFKYKETEDSEDIKVLDAGNPNITDIVFNEEDNTITYKYKGTSHTVYYAGEMTGNYYKYYTGYYYLPDNTPFTVSMQEGWNLRITNLPKETTYTITESDIDSKYEFVRVDNVPTNHTPTDTTYAYEDSENEDRITSATIEGSIDETNIAYGHTFINKNVYKDITVTKEWAGNYTQDNITLPTSVQVQLYAGEDTVGTPVTVKNDTWTYTWTGLDVNDEDGNPINYWVREIETNLIKLTEQAGTFYSTVEDFTITNTYIPRTVDVTVTKVWAGNPAQDNVTQPTSIKVQLLGKNGALVEEVTLSSPNYTHTWTVPENDADGNKINYTVAEVAEGLIKLTRTEGYYYATVNGYTITNTYIPKTVTVTVNKVWAGNPSQDKVTQPTSITVQLLGKDGALVEEVTLSSPNYTHTWTVPENDADGNKINYTVAEVEEGLIKLTQTPGYYYGTVDGYTITNTYIPKTVTVTVNKVWAGNPAQDNVTQPSSIKVQLLGANGSLVEEVTLTSPNYTHTWTVPENDVNGNKINYTVAEVEEGLIKLTQTPGYYYGTVDGYTITNTYIPKTVTVTVNKVWAGDPSQDNVTQPTSITVQLLGKDGALVEEVTLSSPNYTHTWTVPENDANGNPITYTIAEVAEGLIKLERTAGYYYATVDGYTITNTYIPRTSTITVNKVWAGNPSQDNVTQPASIKVQLLKGNGELVEEVTLSSPNYTYTWTVPENDANGNPITYTIAEVEEGLIKLERTAGYYYATVDGYTITNTYIPRTVDVTVNKVWAGNPSQDKVTQPDSVTVQLLGKDGALVEEVTLESPNYTHTWTVPENDANGNPITYTIAEVEEGLIKLERTAGYYYATVDGYTITNTYIPRTVDVTVNKVWAGNPGQDNVTQPSSIKVQLLGKDGALVEEVTLNSPDYTHTWTVPENDENGNPITYTVAEVEEGLIKLEETAGYYYATVDGYTITNTYIPQVRDITVNKVWAGNPSQDNVSIPDSVQVQLYAGNDKVNGPITLTSDTWSYTWNGLEVNDANGNPINYWVEEIETDLIKLEKENGTFYSTVDEFTITNTYITQKRDIYVHKTWDDKDNYDGLRTDYVTVTLFANGEQVGDSVTLDEDHYWEYTWTGLELHNEDGSDVEYTIEEDKVEGYETEIEETEEGFEIINWRAGTGGDVPPTNNPQTGDNIYMYIAMVVISLMGLLTTSYIYCKNN